MDSKATATRFAALSQETRVRLLQLLAPSGAGGMAAGALAGRLGVPPSTLSFHLAALEQAGLVRATRNGRQMIYAVRPGGLRDLLGFVTEACCVGRPDLGAALARLLPDDEEQPPAMTPSFNVLFLCTRNSARSIMAEAILETLGRGRFRAYSAGSHPAAAPNPEVIRKLQALGHDTSRLRSKSWDAFARPDAPRMDFVIALCDTTTGQRCPEFGATAVTASWPLPDPLAFTGSAIERGVLLDALYAMIRRRLEIFCALPFATLDQRALAARLDVLAGAMAAAA